MSLVCKTPVLIEDPEILRMVTEVFPYLKYELQFADSLDEAAAHASSKHIDMFIVGSKFAGDDKMDFIRRNFPTMIVEQEYVSQSIYHTDGSNSFEEASKIKISAEKLLCRSHINWIVNAPEYSS